MATLDILHRAASRLACPACGASGLRVTGSGDEGSANCRQCGDATMIISGIWQSQRVGLPRRSATTLLNNAAVSPLLYEPVWRPRSTGLLSRGGLPVRRELAEMLAAVQPAPGSLIVDVGCSQGLYARELAQAGAEVIAVDYSQAFLRSAVRRAASANVSIAPTRSLAQHLPLADASVDAAVSGGTLNDCGDPPAVVDELARVVRPGGCLFSMSLIGSHKRFGRTVMAVLGRSGMWFPDAVTTRALFESSGWIVRSERLDGLVLRLVLQRP